MKWAHRLLGIVLGTLLLGVCFRILLPLFQGGVSWLNFLDELSRQRVMVLVMTFSFIFLLVAYVLSAMHASPGSKYLAYETQYGNISISLRALQDFLAHLKNEFSQIVSLVPKVTVPNEGLDVVLEVKVKSGAPIPEISRMLQERARALITEKIGIADIENIEIKVEEIVMEKETTHAIKPVPPPAGEES